MIDDNLLDYIRDGLKKGYSKKELLEILKKNNWEDYEIQEAFKKIETPSNIDPGLSLFVRKSLGKGIPKGKIVAALIQKGWKPNSIEDAFTEAERSVKVVKEPVKTKQTKTLTQGILFFLIAFLIISFTATAFFYENGIVNYQTDCVSKTGTCIDSSSHSMQEVKDNLWVSLSAAFGISLVLTLLYVLLPFRKIILWGANILYFLFLAYMALIWFTK